MISALYDNTFEGFLTGIFEYYERRWSRVRLVPTHRHQPDVFSSVYRIQTDDAKAARVWEGLKKRLSPEAQQHFYYSFLSEKPEREAQLLDYAQRTFADMGWVEEQYGAVSVLWVARTGHRVWIEQHRMEAFVRFEKTDEGLFYAHIEPDFNVLPIIAPHFVERYADQEWLIYDGRRRYGLHFDRQELQRIEFELEEGESRRLSYEAQEPVYQHLWKTYFESVNIPARRNLKLHRRMVPQRYWRFLTEKQPELSRPRAIPTALKG
ncbi:probable DNA metabolism protein [Catalinimonas alkaloidigena]|uniref:Probable DNA metabolism protein n=1 Tax=Catalinimonas alkaloidigena TaxID=1075417 RepID=A0A1G9UBY2_9BACT|nr:TIGR03915 family putative DNA repair protein [Catalinimonas alkaloidigena]SDM57409.1 probable DNA metabolism protein [Catalinimonas alkaloidigena]